MKKTIIINEQQYKLILEQSDTPYDREVIEDMCVNFSNIIVSNKIDTLEASLDRIRTLWHKGAVGDEGVDLGINTDDWPTERRRVIAAELHNEMCKAVEKVLKKFNPQESDENVADITSDIVV